MLAVRGEHVPQREQQSMASGPPTSEKPKGLYMRLPARAENVAVVRHALAGMAEQIGMDETGIADLKTVVTEACMNVVVHAYPGGSGPLTIEAHPDTEGLTVTVSDSGARLVTQAIDRRGQTAATLGDIVKHRQRDRFETVLAPRSFRVAQQT